MSQKYPGGFITKSPVAPTTAAAKGIWTLNQVAEYTKQGIWPRIPGAPTIGTATATGTTTATVAFTPPTDLGSGTITYTATSSPGGVTGTGTSPITVSGLTINTAYTFTVTASTPGGTGPASAASNSVTPALPAIGAAYEGGFYAGQISTTANGVANFNLVVGPASSAENTSKQFKNDLSFTSGTNSKIDGPANSTAENNASHPAAQFCEAVVVGGFSDWYLPAEKELEILYYNLKPTTDSNITGGGNTNDYSVPKRTTTYTAGIPAQTSAAIFQIGGSEAFIDGLYYWSSTQSPYSADRAYLKGFRSGESGTAYKTNSFKVRAIRRVPV
jgi:hypothetical protein